MRRYKKFLDNVSQEVPRTTAYNRRLAQMNYVEPGADENMDVRNFFFNLIISNIDIITNTFFLGLLFFIL